jgi:leucyl-tRNA synthetase
MAEVNKFKVPLRQWRKWNEMERGTFNEVHDLFLHNQQIMCHPKMPKIAEEHWSTIAWNAAWTAADAARGVRLTGVVDLDAQGNEVKRYRVKRAAAKKNPPRLSA